MAKASSKTKSTEILGYAVVIGVIAVVLVAIYYVYRAQQLSSLPPAESQVSKLSQKPTPILTPTPMPKIIGHGKTAYNISTNWPGPKFTYISMDPQDPAQGQQMTIIATVNDTTPAQKVWATVATDHKKSADIVFRRISGTDAAGDWLGTWTTDDTYNYNLTVTIQGQNANGYTKDDVTIR